MVSNKEEISRLKDMVSYQNDEIKNLLKRVATLEGKLMQVEADKAISSHINDILHNKIDELNQRFYLIIEGVPLPTNNSEADDVEKKIRTLLKDELGISDQIIHRDFDKAHRIGPKITTNHETVEQSVIVRLKSHSLREKIYRERNNSRKLKVRISLTKKRWRKLLNYAKELTEDIDRVDFVFADIHDKLKVRLKYINGIYMVAKPPCSI